MKKSIASLSAFVLTLVLIGSVWADPVPKQTISVTSPPYCSDISGKTTLSISAPGLTTVDVRCWKQGDGFGSDSLVGTVQLDGQGNGTIDFPADDYPHGPITVRIGGHNDKVSDNCYLQLYNKGGVSWNEGLPKDPPGADGMKLIFADDFNKPLSISSTDTKATYYPHKPPDGSQDFSSLRFTDFDSPNNPFLQEDTYLRIRADASKNSSGLLSSVKNDGSGVAVSIPCYFECKFIAPSAPGTWPAFWLLTNYMTAPNHGQNMPVDELDIIEAVGGEGPGAPNGDGSVKNSDLYQITPHAWNQPENKDLEKTAWQDMHDPIDMGKFGVPSSWFWTFHTYGCKITDSDTIYYLDNIEVARHPTLPASKKYPLFFLINLATGGGWPVNLSRYDGKADMYVDFVRVYSGAPDATPVP